MTTATATKTFRVAYSCTFYYDVEVERPADITEEELIESISLEEFRTGEDSGYNGVKEAWREKSVSLILDENGESAF
tara:strand:+ start:323 stop:553 length:231 start_codon:yes stop_codon:yes gene_type:complete